ncbi:MAG: FAD-dependent oxidoreductase [Deltaproteobacteria bacterium]|nr:FAD-dependent oxidoreductase [Deltaproteobacteria bacterium]
MKGEELAAQSPWLTQMPPPAPPLEGEREADVCVIGGGFAGLSCALALRGEGLDVVVLEAESAGYGASGRNAGHLTPTIGKDLPTLCSLYSEEKVRGLVRLASTSIAHVEGLIRDHAIECDYEPVGNVISAVHPKQHASIERAARAAQAHDLEGELLDAAGMERRGLPRSFTCGYHETRGGVLDPGKLLRGIRAAALAAGSALHEGSPATQIHEGSPAVVETPRGRVRCRHVVIATNAYTPSLGRLRSAALRIQVQLFHTEPLTPAQREAVGWAGRAGIYTAHEILESYRWTADHRILGGSKFIRAGYGDRVLPDTDPRLCARLEAVFRERFPELPDVRVERHWGGPIFMSLDFLPRVGRGGRHQNLLHAIGWAGHGVAQASYAGVMLADLLCERAGPGAALWSRRSIPLPPEPLRWLAFRGLTGWFESVDRRVDKAVVRRRPRPAVGRRS